MTFQCHWRPHASRVADTRSNEQVAALGPTPKGSSKGGSAGHLALAIRHQASGDDLVYSANIYADRAANHAEGFYTDDLMIRIPKKEYLFKIRSSPADTTSFGLDCAKFLSGRRLVAAVNANIPTDMAMKLLKE